MTTANPLPFNVQAPIPPYFVYGTGVSTYTAHYGKKRQPSRQRMVTPPRLPVKKPSRKISDAAYTSGPRAPSRRAVSEAVQEYVETLSQNNRAVYNAMAPVLISNPYKEAARRRDDFTVLPPRQILATQLSAAVARKDASGEARRSAAAAASYVRPHTPPPPRPTPMATVAAETIGSYVASSKTAKHSSANQHWICWDTGNLEPPGLQTRLIKPWPSPLPPRTPAPIGYNGTGRVLTGNAINRNVATHASYASQAAAAARHPTRFYANYPVPDDIAMTDLHQTLLDREESFYRDPEAIAYDMRAPYYIPNYRTWYTEDGYRRDENQCQRHYSGTIDSLNNELVAVRPYGLDNYEDYDEDNETELSGQTYRKSKL